MRAVRFVRHEPPYVAGEVAGFPDEIAARLIARGVAADAAESTADTAPAQETTPAPAPAPAMPVGGAPKSKLKRVNVAATIAADAIVSEA